jgi:hypothetical protein
MRLLSVKWKPFFEYQSFQSFVPLDFSKPKLLWMRFNNSCCNKARNSRDTEHIVSPTGNVCTAISFPNNLVLISSPLQEGGREITFHFIYHKFNALFTYYKINV